MRSKIKSRINMCIVLASFIIASIGAFGAISGGIHAELTNIVSTPQSSDTYTPRSNLYYDEESDLVGIPGSGTLNDPFVISGYDFHDSQPSGFYTIALYNLRSYIIFSNCLMEANGTAGRSAMYIENCSKIDIVNCEFTSNNPLGGCCAVEIVNCTNMVCSGNDVNNFGIGMGFGVHHNSTDIEITNNIIVNTDNPIYCGLMGMDPMRLKDITIANNIIKFCDTGVHVGATDTVLVQNNLLYKCTYDVAYEYIHFIDATDVYCADNTIIEEFTDVEIFASAVEVELGTSIDFDCKSIGGCGPFTYQWNFSDGSQFGTDESESHEYAAIGTYIVNVTVTDVDGDVVTGLLEIEIVEDPNGNDIPGFPTPILLVIFVVGIGFLLKKQKVIKN